MDDEVDEDSLIRGYAMPSGSTSPTIKGLPAPWLFSGFFGLGGAPPQDASQAGPAQPSSPQSKPRSGLGNIMVGGGGDLSAQDGQADAASIEDLQSRRLR